MSASRLPSAFPARTLTGIALAASLAPAVVAAVDCTGSSSDGRVTIEVRVDSPSPSQLIAAGPPCPDTVPVTGVVSANGIPPRFDAYVVMDSSGSTGACTGVDVDGDGTIGVTGSQGTTCSDVGDSVYQAEVEAIRRLVAVLLPGDVRIGIISFADPFSTDIVLSLTDDPALIQSAVDTLAMRFPFGSTDFETAQKLARAQLQSLGDPARDWIVLFLSDGSPTWPEPPTCCLPTTAGDTQASLDEAQRLADAGITMHTYAIGAQANRNILRAMANLTGGRAFAFTNPGDVVDILPGSVLTGIDFLMVENLTLGEVAPAEIGPLGDFRADVPVIHGWNDILVTAQAFRKGEVQVPCPVRFYFACGRGCEPDTQGFWHRECMAAGEIPSGNGSRDLEFHVPEFPELQEIVDALLAYSGQTTCEALDADPPSDPCERALKQYAAFLLNIVEGRLGAACSLDPDVLDGLLDPASGLPSSVEELMPLLDQRLREGLDGDQDACKDVNDLADAVNTGLALDGGGGTRLRLLAQPQAPAWYVRGAGDEDSEGGTAKRRRLR